MGKRATKTDKEGKGKQRFVPDFCRDLYVTLIVLILTMFIVDR